MTADHALKPNHLFVAVLTTAGSYPGEGFNEVPESQPVKVELEHAAKALKLTNTTNWVAKVGGTELDIEKSYTTNHLSGKVEINYGPRETGGGASAS